MNRAVQLDSYLASWRDRPFDWTSANCGHFAAQWVALIEPSLEMKPLVFQRGLRSITDAIAAAGNLRELVSYTLRRTAAPSAFAMVGDLVLMHTELNGAVGICNGLHSACLGESGVTFVPTAQTLCAWIIGRAS